MANEDLRKCIYCMRELPRAAFNREHVVPESFGTFEPDNFVLHEAVCLDCNDFFGRGPDQFLGRDTYEGILRYQYGIADLPKTKGDRFKPRRIIFAISEDGPWKGTLLEFKGFLAETGRPHCDFVPQVAFLDSRTQKWTHFAEHELPTRQTAEAKGFDWKILRVLGPDQLTRLRLVELLKGNGFDHKFTSSEERFLDSRPSTSVGVELTFNIDEVIKRAISKMAFNYLAKTHGTKLVLSPDFDDVRRFCRYGDKITWEHFRSEQIPILGSESARRRHFSGHIIVVEWDAASQGINAKVSLFNRITYRVRLCRRFTGVYRELKSGHTFDPTTKQIQKLVGIDKRITIVRIPRI